MTSNGSQHRNGYDHVGCSHYIGNEKKIVGSRTIGSSCLSSSEKDARNLDPTTPNRKFYEDKDLNILEAEIEKDWTKVVNRKKNKKKI